MSDEIQKVVLSTRRVGIHKIQRHSRPGANVSRANVCGAANRSLSALKPTEKENTEGTRESGKFKSFEGLVRVKEIVHAHQTLTVEKSFAIPACAKRLLRGSRYRKMHKQGNISRPPSREEREINARVLTSARLINTCIVKGDN